MDNSDEVNNNGVCKNIQLHLEGLNVEVEFYPLIIRQMDVILGFKWLATLAETANSSHNYNWKSDVCIFKTILTFCHTQVTLNPLRRVAKQGEKELYLEIQ